MARRTEVPRPRALKAAIATYVVITFTGIMSRISWVLQVVIVVLGLIVLSFGVVPIREIKYEARGLTIGMDMWRESMGRAMRIVGRVRRGVT